MSATQWPAVQALYSLWLLRALQSSPVVRCECIFSRKIVTYLISNRRYDVSKHTSLPMCMIHNDITLLLLLFKRNGYAQYQTSLDIKYAWLLINAVIVIHWHGIESRFSHGRDFTLDARRAAVSC